MLFRTGSCPPSEIRFSAEGFSKRCSLNWVTGGHPAVPLTSIMLLQIIGGRIKHARDKSESPGRRNKPHSRGVSARLPTCPIAPV